MKQRIERLLLRGPLVGRQAITSATARLKRTVGLPSDPTLYYLTPNANWSIDWDGKYVTTEIRRQFGVATQITFTATGIHGQILHYGALGAFVGNLAQPWNEHNQVVTTIFHGDRTGDEPQLMAQIEQLIAHAHIPRFVVTACSMMAQRLQTWGIPPEKIVQIPLGIDLTQFTPATPVQRQKIRQRLGIPENAICIGSFQKDGVGWGAGSEPKLIKGPDLFLDVIAELCNRHSLFVLLTGPARGYVMDGLQAMGVPYHHELLDNYLDIVDYYRALDLYVVTSREEGGPKALLESLATGVPLVSTRVGMVPDVIDTGVNGLLVDVEDVAGMVAAADQLLNDAQLRQYCIKNGLQTIQSYSWPAVARLYWEKVYSPFFEH